MKNVEVPPTPASVLYVQMRHDTVVSLICTQISILMTLISPG